MITKDTFIFIAMKSYINTQCKTIIEFEEDLSKFSKLSRLCSKESDEEITKAILNATMTLLNIFDNSMCIRLMFFKIHKEDWNKLKTILVYLDRMPNEVPDVKLINEEIPLCQNMVNILRLL